MLSLQVDIRSLVNGGLDCSGPSIRLLAMRAEMVDLIRQRNMMGDIDVSLTIAERPKPHYRPELRRRMAIAKEKPGRGRALSI